MFQQKYGSFLIALSFECLFVFYLMYTCGFNFFLNLMYLTYSRNSFFKVLISSDGGAAYAFF